MTALFDSVTRIARHEAQARQIAAIGEVVDVFDGSGNPPDHAVTVRLRDTGLLLPRVPVAVGVLGYAATAAAGDIVVVLFTDGDLHGAVVVGRLYHSELTPPEHGAGEVVLALPAGSDQPAFRAVLRGADPSLELTLGQDITVKADDTAVQITAGSAEAVVEAAGGGRIRLAIGEASIVISGRGDIEIATTGKLVLHGTDVELKGDATVSISAPQVKVN